MKCSLTRNNSERDITEGVALKFTKPFFDKLCSYDAKINSQVITGDRPMLRHSDFFCHASSLSRHVHCFSLAADNPKQDVFCIVHASQHPKARRVEMVGTGFFLAEMLLQGSRLDTWYT